MQQLLLNISTSPIFLRIAQKDKLLKRQFFAIKATDSGEITLISKKDQWEI